MKLLRGIRRQRKTTWQPLAATIWVVIAAFCWMPHSEAFVVSSKCLLPPRHYPSQAISRNALPTPEESAQALSDYMAKAHEAKLQAVAEEAAKYQARIKELEEKLAACESRNSQESSIVTTTPQPSAPEQTPELPASTSLSLQNAQKVEKEYNSYEFPATNKALAERIGAYQKFISEYIVQAQIEKTRAVADAEAKIRSQFERKIEQQ